jgi:oxaloacetate decarboxylase alpha subunit
MEGLRAGFRVLHTAVAPLARGTSNPAAETTLRNLEAEGFSHRLDLDTLAAVSEHFEELRRRKGLPAGRPQEFDASYYHHQLAGGMVSTTRRMLQELRRPELFGAVLEEVGSVRAEMGYPIIVTPVSQLVATQAVRNVIDGERWANVSDETVRYFLGHYGEPAAPVDPEVADRVLSRPRAEELRELEPLRLDRTRFRAGISDEELLLRLTMPQEQVDAMLSSPAVVTEPKRAPAVTAPSRPGRHPLVTLLHEVSKRQSIRSFRVRKGDELVVYRREA